MRKSECGSWNEGMRNGEGGGGKAEDGIGNGRAESRKKNGESIAQSEYLVAD